MAAIITVLTYSMAMPFIIQSFNIPNYVISIVALLCLIYMKLHLINMLKLKHVGLIKMFKHTTYKAIVAILLLGLTVLISYEINLDSRLGADMIIAMTGSWHIAGLIDMLFDRLQAKAVVKLDMITAKDFERLQSYLNRHDYFIVGDRTINDYVNLKINFPSKDSDTIMTFFSFFLAQPKFAFIIAKTFKDTTLDDDNNLYIDGKLETNPSKIGLYVMNKLSDYSDSEVNVTLT